MRAVIEVNNNADPRARYVGWAPSPARIRLVDPAGLPPLVPTVSVTLRSSAAAGAGRVRFRPASAVGTTVGTPTLALLLPRDGTSVSFQVMGEFGRASSNDGDTRIDVMAGNTNIGSVDLMVRVRKDANTLTPGERDRFIAALAQLNNRGTGRFADFRNMHTAAASPQAHGAPGFLPWHRAYLLDLERELQAIDPSVSLPYWRFDRPAPNVFQREFMGESNAMGVVQWSANNPLQFWVTDGAVGVSRRPLFNVVTSNPSLLTEAQTLAIGASYGAFQSLEGNPHGSAHVAFGGSISSVPSAARDPLFFLLHCNVDRLWALWQRSNGRFDPASALSFDNSSTRVGHRLADSMWPWNGVTGGSRPPTAPGGTLAPSPCTAAPGPSPHVRDMLDYQGRLSAARAAFDYDTVAFG